MKKVISVFLLLTISSNYMLKVAVIITWKCNQDYIAKTLCINRNNPELGCFGKCCLEKELKQVENENHQKDASLPSKFKALETDNYIATWELNSPAILKDQLIHNSIFFNSYSFNYINSCFHPPQV